MLPVSGMHFLVTLAYMVLGLGLLKSFAIRFHDRPIGEAVGFLTF